MDRTWECQKNEGGTLKVNLDTSDTIKIKIESPCGTEKSKTGDSCKDYCEHAGTWRITLHPIEIHSPINIMVTWSPGLPPCNTDEDCPYCWQNCDLDGSITGTPGRCYDFRPYMHGCLFYDYCQDGHDPDNPNIPCSSIRIIIIILQILIKLI